jgi:hypothetical protein
VTTHAPAAHCPVACAALLQAFPQRPQFIGSAAAATSQPSTTLLLQSMYPSRHVFVQLPVEQVV